MWTSTNLSCSSEPVCTQGGHSCGKDGWERASSLPLVLPLTQGFPVMGTSFFESQWKGQTGTEPKATTVGKQADLWCEVLCMEGVILMQIFHVLKHSLYMHVEKQIPALPVLLKCSIMKSLSAVCYLYVSFSLRRNEWSVSGTVYVPWSIPSCDVPGHKMYSAFNVFQNSYSTI